MDVRLPWLPLALAILLALAIVAGAGVAAPAPPPSQETPEPPTVDNTVTRIELAANGSARWTVTIRTRLDTQADVEEYEAFQARFREDPARFLDPFESRIRAVVANAADATGREMTARAFAVETTIQEVPRRWGVVSYTFIWNGFAAVDGDAVVMGDAFDGGFYLAANDTLVVIPPPGYSVTEVNPVPAQRGDRSVGWTGRADFADGRPLVRAAPAGAPGAGSSGDGPSTTLANPSLLGLGAAALALAGLVAAFAYRRRVGANELGLFDTGPGLTDEERVLELLESRGGRVPQSAIVEAFGWSTSKTSRLLSRMADEGTVEKLQLGRENLIQLADGED